jgi:PAS domain S-box-containing protein
LLRQSEARTDALLAASLDAIVIMDAQGCFLEYNAAAEAMFGHRRADVLGKPIADLIIPERLRDAHHQGMTRYLATGTGPVVNQRVELPALRANGDEFPVEIGIVPIAAEGDTAFIGFIRDISDRKQAERRREVLLKELAHRSNNLLTVVRAIMHRTLKDHAAGPAQEILDRRITALARSHAALAANPAGASFRQLVAEEVEGFSDRVQAEGPDLHLNAAASQTLTLIIHELATNATKHGALSTESGRVDVRWSVDPTPPQSFHFEWRERGGPAVMAPTRTGFGRVVLEQISATDFQATPIMTFAPEGLHYQITAALEHLVDPGA